jgi:ubiquinone/menaquinone biosynthesis C-methylase UbiE
MDEEKEIRLENEKTFHAAVAMQERENLVPTPRLLVDRYRHCKRWRTRYPECVIHYLTLNQPAHICDFGCGSGEMACRLGLLGYRVTGLDVSPELIELARERAVLDGVSDRVDFLVADGASVEITDGSFDAVLAMAVIHHMPLDEALNAIERLLKPGGRLALIEPVAYSRTLQWLRDLSPVKKEVSPDERQLSAPELRVIGKRFVIEEQRHFYLFARLRRVVPDIWLTFVDPFLERFDYLLLSIPGVSHFAGIIAILASSRK